MNLITLAQIERAKDVFGNVFENTDNAFPVTNLLLIIAGLVVVMLAAWGFRKHRTDQLKTAPLLTFHRIASKLDINLTQQWLMVRISRQQALPSPLTLLLSAGTFRHHVGLYLEHASPARQHREQIALNAIARSVFGEKAM